MASYRRNISLRLENAGCDRGGQAIVRGVTLGVTPGDAVQLFGANGAGKTTLLNLIAGHLPLVEGSLAWRVDKDGWTPQRSRDAIVYIGHESCVKPALTAKENLLFWAKAYGVPKSKQLDAVYGALSCVAMADHAETRAGRLSAGQRRRIDVARASLADREVWLMDEPAAAVDEQGADIIGGLIADHNAKGGVAIIATHDKLSVTSRKLVIG